MKLLVTGTGRCGTGYMARCFSRLGLLCGHEEVFTPYGPVKERMSKWHGESSWLAAPYVDGLKGVRIINVVRDPYRVLDSMNAIEGFWSNPYGRFASQWLNIVGVTQQEKFVEFYLRWMEMLRDVEIVKVEEVNQPWFERVIGSLGFEPRSLSIDIVPKDYNHKLDYQPREWFGVRRFDEVIAWREKLEYR